MYWGPCLGRLGYSSSRKKKWEQINEPHGVRQMDSGLGPYL